MCARARARVCACDSASGMAVCLRERDTERERFDITEDVRGSTKLYRKHRDKLVNIQIPHDTQTNARKHASFLNLRIFFN